MRLLVACSLAIEDLDIRLGYAGNVCGDRRDLAVGCDLDLLRVQNLSVDHVSQLDRSLRRLPEVAYPATDLVRRLRSLYHRI